MAEFLENNDWRSYKGVVVGGKPKITNGTDGFDAMGKPIPTHRKEAARAHCRDMGLTDQERIWSCVSGMAEALERDQPYQAMKVGMQHLDLIGTYRLMAVLLTARDPDAKPAPKKRRRK